MITTISQITIILFPLTFLIFSPLSPLHPHINSVPATQIQSPQLNVLCIAPSLCLWCAFHLECPTVHLQDPVQILPLLSIFLYQASFFFLSSGEFLVEHIYNIISDFCFLSYHIPQTIFYLNPHLTQTLTRRCTQWTFANTLSSSQSSVIG